MAQEQTETYEEATAEGYWGIKVDPLPNKHYTAGGLDPQSSEAPAPPVAVELGATTENYDDAFEAGYWGTAVDPKSNEIYTVSGVIARAGELFEAPESSAPSPIPPKL